AAGKLALGASTVSAQTDLSYCGFGKGGEECEPQEEVPPLFLHEFAFPPKILTPPMEQKGQGFDQDSVAYGDPFGRYENLRHYYGVLWAGSVQTLLTCQDGSGVLTDDELPQELQCPPAEDGPPPLPRIEFIIRGIRNDLMMVVFLTYATKEPAYAAQNRDMWEQMLGGPIRNGQMDLDLETFQVIAGIRVDPESAALGGNPPTPLGKIPPMRTRSIIIPVDLSDLNDESLLDNHLFFQAIAVPLDPTGQFMMTESQASEVDHFIIERPDFDNLDNDCGSMPVDGVCTGAQLCPDGSPLDSSGKCS
ncbi:MAG: hypothetical protein GY862_04325, partial [Gammaproteobacteria bacterium]|nr:hypothetical protein [Gammaproteobacteria bacterium]